ncbi:unnamed protein product, partial [Pelagomonas calceolata]
HTIITPSLLRDSHGRHLSFWLLPVFAARGPPSDRPPLAPLFFCGRALAFARAACAAAEAGLPLRPPFLAAARALSIAATSTGAADGLPSSAAAADCMPSAAGAAFSSVTLSAAAAGFLPRRRRCFLTLSAVPFGSSEPFCAASGVPGCSGTTALAVSGAAQASTASRARSCIAFSTQAAIFSTVSIAMPRRAAYDANAKALRKNVYRVSNERCKNQIWQRAC